MSTPLDWPGFGSLSPIALSVLCVAAFAAGAVDAIVGGGGLIQLPALLLFAPGGAAVYSVGAPTKLAAVVGTAAAVPGYARRVRLDWPHALPMAATALAGAVGGAGFAAALPSTVLTVVVLVALVAVGYYTWRRPELGIAHAPRFGRRHQLLAMLVLCFLAVLAAVIAQVVAQAVL